MRTTIIVFLLTIFVFNIAHGRSNRGLRRINTLKFYITKTTNELFEKHANVMLKVIVLLNKMHMVKDSLLDNTIQRVLAELKNDNSSCGASTRKKIDHWNYTHCDADFRAAAQSLQTNVTLLSDKSALLIEQMDDIVLGCCSPDRKKVETCVLSKLNAPKKVTKNHIADVESLIFKVNSLTNNLKIKHDQCFTDVVKELLKVVPDESNCLNTSIYSNTIKKNTFYRTSWTIN